MSQPNDFTSIPRRFWSFESGAPFKACSLCRSSLIDSGTSYHIEKAYKKTEVLYECAICADCRDKLIKELSVKSLNLITNYLGEHVDPAERYDQLMKDHFDTPEAWISHCMVKDTPVSDMEEYQICGEFFDTHLCYSIFPYALGEQAIEELTQLLSDETRGALDDFSNKLFDIDLSNPLLLL